MSSPSLDCGKLWQAKPREFSMRTPWRISSRTPQQHQFIQWRSGNAASVYLNISTHRQSQTNFSCMHSCPSSIMFQAAFLLTAPATFFNFRPLSLVGHLKTTGRQEMLLLESGRRRFLLLSTSLVEK